MMVPHFPSGRRRPVQVGVAALRGWKPQLHRLLAVMLFFVVSGTLRLCSQEISPLLILHDLNLSGEFRQRIEDRELIDHYQHASYATDFDVPPVSVKPVARRASERRGTIRPVHMLPSDAWERDHHLAMEQLHPLRGYRAPILQRSGEIWPSLLPKSLSEAERAAAELIRHGLASDGILLTLAKVIQALGPTNFRAMEMAAIIQLRTVGFPVDWLEYFQLVKDGKMIGTPAEWSGWMANQFANSQSLSSIADEIKTATFRFRQSAPGFQIATESGEYPLALMRVQIGGGYHNGVVPGSNLDLMGHLVEAMPETDLLISIEEEYFDPVRWLAGHSWPLKRHNHLTLIGEPFRVSAWAQDNGKPGSLRTDDRGTNGFALIVPRYASIDEGAALFEPGESFLMEGVRAAGLAAIQSPLLFQGGNVLAVRDPSSGKRILVLGEGSICRNMTLGLSRGQVLTAFQIEFGVDECLVLPAASFHLDYDVSIRLDGGRLVAFVNDPIAAACLIANLGIDTLEKHGLLAGTEASSARAHLGAGNNSELLQLFSKTLQQYRDSNGKYQQKLARCFESEAVDSPTANLQCFLVALDFLAPQDVPRKDGLDPKHSGYLEALVRLQMALSEQRKLLAARHWKVVAIPSLPDMEMSINYLNGVHDRARYLMPAYGGFYAALDRAAAAAFTGALGDTVAIVPLLCADSQRSHGAIHCVISAFPQLEPAR